MGINIITSYWILKFIMVSCPTESKQYAYLRFGICRCFHQITDFEVNHSKHFSWANMRKWNHSVRVAAAANKLLQCPTLCDPTDDSPPGFAIPGILQARTLEGVAISFSNAWKRKVKVKSLSRVQLFVTPWTAAHQAPPSMGFSRQEYWSGLPFPSPGDLPNPGIKPESPAL